MERAGDDRPTDRAPVACDPAIQGGVPVFAGTRIPVEVVTAMREAGWTEDQIRAEFPGLP